MPMDDHPECSRADHEAGEAYVGRAVGVRVLWPYLTFAFILIGAFVALDLTGLTKGMSDSTTTALMFGAAMLFVVVMHRRQFQERLGMRDVRTLALLLAMAATLAIVALLASRSGPLSHMLQFKGVELLILIGIATAVFATQRRT